MDKLKDFLKRLDIEKVSLDLIKVALSHPSYTKEAGIDKIHSYERLEFLGDAVLKLASSNFLFENYGLYSEGVLTKIRSYIVSDETLADFALKLGFADVILMSEAEEKDGGRNKRMILACAFESVLGAIFLTYGYEFCEKYLNNIYKSKIFEIVKNLDKLNPKANLQEYLQGKGKALPQYKIINEFGPAHNKTFECEVFVDGKSMAKAMASTKKEAEGEAARIALSVLESGNE